MKILLLLIIVFFAGFQAFSQNKTGTAPSGLPPGYWEQMQKMMPPGTKITPEMQKAMENAMKMDGQQNPSGSGDPSGQETIPTPKPLIQMAPVQEDSYTPEPSPQADYSPFGSGRNEAQRKAALIAVETELNAKPLILPLPESTPTKEYMLKMAAERSKLAKQKFSPNELNDYTKTVIWTTQFDGTKTDPQKAKEYSILVALATNNKPAPYFNIAFASAVFVLDPLSSSGSNNLASAILSGGELICEKTPTKEALAPYRRDAESAFLYAISHSMKDNTWSEASLTPVINLGNLCIDLGRMEEARSLFMVARKIKPESWDAALGLAAYFLALNQKDKALAILEDDSLDKPEKYGVPIKHNKSLEKSEPFSDLPLEAPDEKYEKGIKIMAGEPIATSADFLAQLDQSERNKMRYFIENLPVKGSYAAPSIKKLTQYSTLKAISGPQGVSALKDFSDRLGIFTMGSSISTSKQQIDMLAKMGLKIDIDIDLDDAAKHPEKYMDNKNEPKVTVSGKEEFLAKMQAMIKDAQKARLDLASGKTNSLTQMVSKFDKLHAILLINPEEYADPMNIILQKMNYTVYNRKDRLYKSYLYSLNKRTYRQISEVIAQCQRKMGDLAKRAGAEMEAYEKQRAEAEKSEGFRKAEWDLRRHNLHIKFFNEANNIAETGFGSATNVVASVYMRQFKPNVEAYYYDVIRHVAMISDPEVRKQKDADLHNSMNQAVTRYLQTVLIAHGSFSYSEDWDCNCDMEELLAAREAEDKAFEKEENARIARNKAAKAVFDSGEIPESSPLFKKLDAYVDVYNFGLVKVRASCARTVIEANTDFLPNNLPFNFHYASSESENTGAITRNGGIKVGYEKDLGNEGKATANLNLDISVSSDGNGVVKNYSVTGGANAGVEVGNFKASAGVDGSVSVDNKTGNYSASGNANASASAGNTTVSGSVGGGVTSNNGVTDYSISGSANASVKYGNTSVSGGVSATLGNNGLETDFSTGVSRDFKNGLGTDANAGFEASTKRGCTFSGKVEQTINPAGVQVQKDAVEQVKKDSGLKMNTDFYTKDIWSGSYTIGGSKNEKP